MLATRHRLVGGPTKNRSSRSVPVPSFVGKLLETEIADREDGDLVFPSARGGGYLTLGQARYTFQKACAAVDGCKGVRLTISDTPAHRWQSGPGRT